MTCLNPILHMFVQIKNVFFHSLQFSLNAGSKEKINGTFCLARTCFQWTGSHYHSLVENLGNSERNNAVTRFMFVKSYHTFWVLHCLKVVSFLSYQIINKLKDLPLNFVKWSPMWTVWIFSRKTSTCNFILWITSIPCWTFSGLF